MDNIDDLIGVTTSPVDIHDLMPTDLPPMPLPEGMVRNRAATTAMLSDPSKMGDNFNTMMVEAKDGREDYAKTLQSQIKQSFNAEDNSSYLSILADPKIPMDRKLAIVEDRRRNNTINTDLGIGLLTKGLQEPSNGESEEAEKARLSVSDSLAELYQQREGIQTLINGYVASVDSSTGKAMGDLTSSVVAPFSNNILMATIMQAKTGSFWKGLKAFVDPGGAKMELKLTDDIPIAQRKQATEELWSLINNNAVTLGVSDNHYAKVELVQQLLQDGNYGNFERWVDTLSAGLDLLGLGAVVRSRNVAKTAAASKPASEAAATASAGVKAPSVASEIAKTTGRPTTGVFDERIKALQDEAAKLLGEAGNTLDKGQVKSLNTERKQIANSVPDLNSLAKSIQDEKGITSKAAKAEASKIIEAKQADVQASLVRIDTQLEANRNASTLTQRVADIEKEIARLEKNNTPVFIKKNPIVDAISSIEMNGVARVANPTSPIETMKLANPERVRAMHESILMAPTDEAAKAAAGVERVQALANNVLPQISVANKVAAGVVDVERNLKSKLRIADDTFRASAETAHTMLSPDELAIATQSRLNRFRDVEGLTIRPDMGGLVHEGDGLNLNISAVYGGTQGDFVRVEDAVNLAKRSLRHMGIQDSEIEVLAKKGIGYEVVDKEALKGVDGSYLVRVKTAHTIDPTDVVSMEKSTVRFNWADAVPYLSKNNVANMLMDYGSMLDPKLTRSMSVATDKVAGFEKTMLDLADEFAQPFNKLSNEEKTRLDKYFREANFNALPFDKTDLKFTRGFSDTAVEAARKWRDYWDAHYYLENLDVIRSLRNDGYMKFENGVAELFAKEYKVKDSTIRKVYDPDADKIVILSKTELDDLYAKGGSYAKLRRPSPIQGEEIEYMIVRNNGNSYLRALRDNDKVLNYREGYFQLQYKAARFIDKYDAALGNRPRAVAVARDTPSAKAAVDRLNKQAGPGVVYRERADERAWIHGSDDWFDVEAASGRIAQRHRGQVLERSDGINHLGDETSYIVDPVTSAIRSAKSIAGRTIMRPVLDMSKKRFMEQYGHLVPEVNGMKKFPNDLSQIGERGSAFTKEVADARTTFNYIKIMENGYINSMDGLYKQTLNAIAEGLGNLGLGRAQRGAIATAEFGPNQLAKGTVFNAYIATNPIRQLIVQSHQGVRTLSYNPIGWANGKVPSYITNYLLDSMKDAKAVRTGEMKEFIDFVNDSKMLEAVDRNNLIRGSLLEAADRSAAANIARMAMKPVDFARKIGFDKGEQMNNLVHLAAVFEKYKREGKNVADALVKDEMHSVVRAVGYDMNAAGDFAYNHGFASAILQFMQVPHKAVLNYTNRKIPVADRMKLAVGDLMFWGGPFYLLNEWFGTKLPEDPDARMALLDGLEGLVINKALQSIIGDDQFKLDTSSLAPMDLAGSSEAVRTLLTEGPLAAISVSPAGQLFGVNFTDKPDRGGKIPYAFKNAMMFFNGFDDTTQSPKEFVDVVKDFANISSGLSNGMQAYAMLEMEKKANKLGITVRNNVDYAEAIAKVAGFNEASQMQTFQLVDKINKKERDIEKEIVKDVKFFAQYYQDKYGQGVQDSKQLTALTGTLLKRYTDDPKAYDIVRREVAKLLKDPDNKLMETIMRSSGFKDSYDIEERMKDINMPVENKEAILGFVKSIKEYKE